MLPGIPLNRSFLPPLEDFIAGLGEIWETGQVSNDGPILKRFEEKLARYLGTDQLCAVANGTLGLQIALQAMCAPGSEVITTPFTFVATANAIVAAGLKPVFVDVEPTYYTLDPFRVEEAITPQTSAILPVHIYGYPCQVDVFEEIAQRRGVKLIYDAAQAFGVRHRGRDIGSYGDASVFSFHGTKIMHTCEGGLICYRDARLGSLLSKWRHFGFEGDLNVSLPGTNAKMNELSALMGCLNLEYVEGNILRRQRLVDLYYKELGDVPGIELAPPLPAEVRYNCAYMPVLVNAREFGRVRTSLYRALQRMGIATRRYFYPLVSRYRYYKRIGSKQPLLVAGCISQRVLSLPLFSDMHESQVLRVCDAIRNLRIEGKLS